MSTYSDGANEQAHIDARLDVAAIKAAALREAADHFRTLGDDLSICAGHVTAELDARADRLTEGGTDA